MNKTTNLLLRLVEERAQQKRAEEEKRKQQEELLIPYLPKECIFNILVRLPLESLQISRFVCKQWYNMINSSLFIDAHLRRSETVLIFQTPILKYGWRLFPTTSTPPKEKPNAFSVEEKLFQMESVAVLRRPIISPASKNCIKYLEIRDGKTKIGDFNASCLGKIKASCNGLILLTNKIKQGGLLVMNPVTRAVIGLPVGTLYPSHKESYGFAFSHLSGEYKVVHLFWDEMDFINCEIIRVGKKSWRMVNGPAFGLFGWFGYKPVFAIGALHWVPQIDHNDFLVSIDVDNEQFQTIPLPEISRTHDGIVEIGGFLGFMNHDQEINQMYIWVLKGLCGENWIKRYTITVGCIMDMVPLFSLRMKEEMIFKRDEDGSLYAYDFQREVMRKVELPKECSAVLGSYLPHVNSLVNWFSSEDSRAEF